MADYIFAERNNIHIIDLQKSLKGLKIACNFIKEEIAKGKQILFVGTKKQAQNAIQEEAQKCGAFYVIRRWLGGTLTNFKTIKQRLFRLKELEKMEQEGVFDLLGKKEAASLRREKEKLEKLVGGIKEMNELPGLIYVVDTKKEKIAVTEARKLNIPIVAIVDTNSDPDEVDYCVPGNDDAIRAVKLITSAIADAVIEGRKLAEQKKMEIEKIEAEEEQKVEDQKKKKVSEITEQVLTEQIPAQYLSDDNFPILEEYPQGEEGLLFTSEEEQESEQEGQPQMDSREVPTSESETKKENSPTQD
jgi:small subunit ribosomal protein S2